MFTDGNDFTVLCHACKPQHHQEFTKNLPLCLLKGKRVLHVMAAVRSETVHNLLQTGEPRSEWEAYFPEPPPSGAISPQSPRRSRTPTLRCQACNLGAPTFVRTNEGGIACTACVGLIDGGVIAGSEMRRAKDCQRWIKSADATSRREAAAAADAAAAAAERAARQAKQLASSSSTLPASLITGAAATTISQPRPRSRDQGGGAKSIVSEAALQKYRKANCRHSHGPTFELVSYRRAVVCDICGTAEFKEGFSCKFCTQTSESGLPTFDCCFACFKYISPTRPHQLGRKRQKQQQQPQQQPQPRAAATSSSPVSEDVEGSSSDDSTAESESGSGDEDLPVPRMVRTLQNQNPAARQQELAAQREKMSKKLQRLFWTSAAHHHRGTHIGDAMNTPIMKRYNSDLLGISARGGLGIVVVDLCAGIGGNLISLIRSGFKIDLYIFVEKDDMCRAVLEDCCKTFGVKYVSHSNVLESGLDSDGAILDQNLCVIPAGRMLSTLLSRIVPHTHAHRSLSLLFSSFDRFSFISGMVRDRLQPRRDSLD